MQRYSISILAPALALAAVFGIFGTPTAAFATTITTPYWCGSYYSSSPCVGGYYTYGSGSSYYTQPQQYYYYDWYPYQYGYGYNNYYYPYGYYPYGYSGGTNQPNYWGYCYYTSGVGPSYRYPCQYRYQNYQNCGGWGGCSYQNQNQFYYPNSYWGW